MLVTTKTSSSFCRNLFRDKKTTFFSNSSRLFIFKNNGKATPDPPPPPPPPPPRAPPPISHKIIFDHVSDFLKIEKLEDWYPIKASQIDSVPPLNINSSSPIAKHRKKNGQSLLVVRPRTILSKFYNNSLHEALSTIYPNFDWKPWKFQFTRRGFWKRKENRKKFFEEIFRQLEKNPTEGDRANHKPHEVWYGISKRDIERNGGSGMLSHYYKDSIYSAIVDLFYPPSLLQQQEPISPWLFRNISVPRSFWKSKQNRRSYLDWFFSTSNLSQRRPLSSIRDLPKKELLLLEERKLFGKRNLNFILKKYYAGSIRNALGELYPDEASRPPSPKKTQEEDGVFEIGPAVARSYWDLRENRLKYFDWIASEMMLGIARPEDWYGVALQDIQGKISSSSVRIPEDDLPFVRSTSFSAVLRKYYGGSLYNALSDLYPDQRWLPWRFACVPHNFWKNKEHRRQYFDWIRSKHLDKIDDNNNAPHSSSALRHAFWAIPEIRKAIKEERACSGILSHYYRGSLSNALKDLYPELNIGPSKGATKQH